MRNVWRAPFPDQFPLLYAMFKIYCNSHGPGHTCPPDHTVRNVWRASPSASGGPLGAPLWPTGRQDRPRTPERFRPTPVWTPNVANECLPHLTSACPQLHPDLPSGNFRSRERHAHEVARRHRAGSGDRENPKLEGANHIPGLPVMTGPP